MPKITIVIPTMGERISYLANAISSIRSAGNAHILVVGPIEKRTEIEKLGVDQFESDPNKGLVAAINHGFEKMPNDTEFTNWLGDDDELTSNSLVTAAEALENNPSSPFVFGACGYINESGQELWVNQSGNWAVPLLRFGPDLIPQPGALLRVDALKKVLPLEAKYKFAFDFDMFIELSKLGKPIYLSEKLANFRWHQDSLTVSQRKKSAQEASWVRKSHLPDGLRAISEVWELPVRFATNVLGARMLARQTKKLAK